MRRFLTSLSVVIMMCLVCISCKKDDETTFPAEFKAGLWYGVNASTGGSIDAEFGVSSSSGQTCVITLTSADQKTVNQFSGRFTYDALKGAVNVTFDEMNGAPKGTTFQFDNSGKALAVSIESTSVNYGSYVLTLVTYPKSIAGAWGGNDSNGNSLTAKLEALAINGGIPFTIVYTPKGGQAIPMSGTYNYNSENGKIDMIVNMAGGPTVEANYDAKINKIVCNVTVAGTKITFNLERLLAK